MTWWMEIAPNDPAPKRGDLMQTAIGSPKERTWFILRAVPMRRAKNRRYAIRRARWWELEPEFRVKLYQSASRNGGQTTWHTRPRKVIQKPKRKMFEDYMLREVVL